MTDSKNIFRNLERNLPTIPGDIVAVALLVIATDVVVFVYPTKIPFILPLLGLPTVLFVLGYLVVATLYPRRNENSPSRGLTRWMTSRKRVPESHMITWRERIALSFGLSVILIPLFGLVIGTFANGLNERTVLLGLNFFVLVGAVAGIVSRNLVPKDERFQVPYSRWLAATSESFHEKGVVDRSLSVLVVASVVLAFGTLAFVLTAPTQYEPYTSVTLLTENADGELVASGFPSELEQGESEDMVIRVENNERVETTYTVVAELQEPGGDDGTEVTRQEVLFRTQKTVPAGETWDVSHSIEPTMTGENLRLTYLIYRGDAPEDPSSETAYRSLYFWVDVTPSET